ncbi:MAG TPA: ABC transporter permease [Chryseosolibacter sp.]|nr:ABC transporter permease [Chryseosolibacter sp.]
MEHRIVVDANKSSFSPNLKELVAYRDLFFILAYRDLRVRYAQTFLGLAWAFLQPVVTLIIFTLVFGRFVKVDTGGVPYPAFALCGMAGWTYFAFVMSQSGNSIIGAQEMIKKIYFPRLIIPLSKALVGLVDFAVASLLLIFLIFYYDISVSSQIIFLPCFIILCILAALGIGIWLSALTIRYRDFQHVTPFLVQLGLYVTPIAYPGEIVMRSLPEWAQVAFYLNPMAGIVEGFRWAILGVGSIHALTYVSFFVVVVLFLSGLWYFRSVEKVMADIV